MTIPPTGTSDLYAAAAAFDRQLRSPSDDAGDTSDASAAADAGPDVVVTFSKGASTPATYDASGKLAGTPSLDDLGANAPGSLAHASESVDDAAPPEATPSSSDADGVDAEAALPA